MTLTDFIVLLVSLMVFRPQPKKGLPPKKRRKSIARKSRFKLYDHPGKTYRLEPTENIRRKAEECRVRQMAAENPAELWFAGILNQLGIAFDYQVIFYRTGSFIVADFVIKDHRVVFEIDGRAAHESQRGYDEGRDRWLATQGYRTVRIAAHSVFHKRTEVALLVKQELGL